MTPTNKMPVACFAPPLTDELLARYKALVDGLPEGGEVKDAMLTCYKAVAQWWELPESKRTDGDRFKIKHRGRDVKFSLTPLEEEHVKALWDAVPWMRECDSMLALFETLPTGTVEVPCEITTARGVSKATRNEVVDAAAFELRTAAMHLLWHAKELTLDREPLTSNRLPA